MREIRKSWFVIGGVVLVMALISMACSLSTASIPNTSPNFPSNQGSQPTLAETAVVPPLPTSSAGGGATLATDTPSAGGAAAPTTAAPSTQGGSGAIPSTGGPVNPPTSLAELYKQVNPGVVSILVAVNSGGQQGEGAGSGFVITNDGYIATNFHVAGDASQIVVRFYNNVDAQAKLVGGDPDSDIAILKVDKYPQGVHALSLGDSSKVQVGDAVVAIGNPFAIGVSMSYGIVSGLGRTIQSLTPNYNIPLAIQTDAAINPGNSGGPLINMAGQVIGIDAQIATGGNSAGGQGGNVGIGFAIPINIFKQVYPSLIKNGSYSWPYLGIGSAQTDPLAANVNNVANVQGAVIDQVIAGGPAEQAGLRQGDVVTAIDGQKITSFDDLLGIIAFKHPGDKVNLTIHRGSQAGNVTVTLGARPKGSQNANP